MRKIALTLLLLALVVVLKAQTITETPEWNKLIAALQDEQWQNASDLSNQCLKKASESEPKSEIIPVLRYMVILSESGMMNDGKLTQQQAISAVKRFEGQEIALPGHPISLKNVAFNSVTMVNKKTDSLYVVASNKKATDIFAFEYIILKEKWPEDDFKLNVGGKCWLSGILSSISVEGHMLPRFRMIINDARYEISD